MPTTTLRLSEDLTSSSKKMAPLQTRESKSVTYTNHMHSLRDLFMFLFRYVVVWKQVNGDVFMDVDIWNSDNPK